MPTQLWRLMETSGPLGIRTSPCLSSPPPPPGRGALPHLESPPWAKVRPESAPRPACTASQAGSLPYYCPGLRQPLASQLTILGAAQAPLSLSSVALCSSYLIVTLKMVTLHVYADSIPLCQVLGYSTLAGWSPCYFM